MGSDTDELQAAGFLCPSFDVWPVPGWTAADGPSWLGEQSSVSPHLDGVSADAEALGDVVGADRVTVHADSMDCNVRVDKCNDRSYSQAMNEHTKAMPLHHQSNHR